MANYEYPERFKTLELETMLEALNEVRPKLIGRHAVSVAKAINSIENVLEARGEPEEGRCDEMMEYRHSDRFDNLGFETTTLDAPACVRRDYDGTLYRDCEPAPWNVQCDEMMEAKEGEVVFFDELANATDGEMRRILKAASWAEVEEQLNQRDSHPVVEQVGALVVVMLVGLLSYLFFM